MQESLSIILKNDRAEIPRLAQIVADFCKRNGLDPAIEADLNLALEEIVINVIKHGYADQEEHDIAVTFWLEPDVLTVCVEDDGVPFNPLDAPPAEVSSPLERRRAGGLGVYLVRNLMDEFEYQRTGTMNVFVMKKHRKDSDR